jgi:hypothetical protein
MAHELIEEEANAKVEHAVEEFVVRNPCECLPLSEKDAQKGVLGQADGG